MNRSRSLYVILAGDHVAGVSSSKTRAAQMRDEVTLRFISSGDPRRVKLVHSHDGRLDRTGLDTT